jgi:hypothetical protein
MLKVFFWYYLQILKQSNCPVDFFLDLYGLLFVEIPEEISIINYLSDLFVIHVAKLAN